MNTCSFNCGVARMLSLCVVACVVASLYACTDEAPQADGSRVRALIDKRQFAAAAVELKTALQSKPEDGDLRLMLGEVLLASGEYESSAVEFAKAVAQGKSEEAVAPMVARALLGAGKANQVVAKFDSVRLADAAAFSDLKATLSLAYLRMGDRASAWRSIEEAAKARPNHGAVLLTMARLHWIDGKLDLALELAHRVISSDSKNGEAQLIKAALLRIKGDEAGTVKALNAALEDPLAVLSARTGLFQVHLAKGDFAKAEAEVASLRKSHARFFGPIYLEGVLAYSKRDYTRADEISEQLLKQRPDYPPFLVLGGAASLHRGALLPAEARLGKVVQTVERAVGARKLLAATYLKSGQAEKALATLKPLLESASTVEGDTLALAGQAQLQLGLVAQAERSFTASLKLKPDDVQARTALAMTAIVRGDTEAGVEALRTVAAADGGDTADLALISTLTKQRQYEAALSAISALEKKAQTSALPSHLRGLTYLAKQDESAARRSFLRALELQPSHFAASIAIANLDAKNRQFDAALERIEGLIKASPGSSAARLAYLEIQARMGAKAEVLMRTIDDAIRASPADHGPRVAKILQLTRQGDRKAAAAAAQQAISALPNDIHVLNAAGGALAAAGDELQAITAFNRLASLSPGSANPHLRIAEVYNRRGDRAAVTSTLSRAFEVAPDDPTVHQRILDFALSTGDNGHALRVARELQKRKPSSAAGYILEGDAHAAKKAWTLALAAHRQALGKSDPGGRVPMRIYDSLLASGASSEATAFAKDWVRQHAQDAAFLRHLGNSALVQSKPQAAEQYFRAALKLQPDDPMLLNNVAWLATDSGAGDALALARRAGSLAPENPRILDTLARALALAGELREATRVQSLAVTLDPTNPDYRLRLGQLYLKVGETDKATAEVKALERLGSNYKRSAEVLELKRALAQKS